LSIDYYATCIVTMEAHLVLLGLKYLDWRVKLYIELAHVYEELGSMDIALRTIEKCN